MNKPRVVNALALFLIAAWIVVSVLDLLGKHSPIQALNSTPIPAIVPTRQVFVTAMSVADSFEQFSELKSLAAATSVIGNNARYVVHYVDGTEKDAKVQDLLLLYEHVQNYLTGNSVPKIRLSTGQWPTTIDLVVVNRGGVFPGVILSGTNTLSGEGSSGEVYKYSVVNLFVATKTTDPNLYTAQMFAQSACLSVEGSSLPTVLCAIVGANVAHARAGESPEQFQRYAKSDAGLIFLEPRLAERIVYVPELYAEFTPAPSAN